MSAILEASQNSLKTGPVSSEEDKEEWWKRFVSLYIMINCQNKYLIILHRRYGIDDRLKCLIGSLESDALGVWRGLLLGLPLDEARHAVYVSEV